MNAQEVYNFAPELEKTIIYIDMKQIGFKNFRRFAKFPSMELSPITIFVGENNAGKSTVVKGILALSDFLNSWRAIEFENTIIEFKNAKGKKRKELIIELLKNQKFYFNTSYLAHIGTFKRAIYNKSDNNIITFFTSLGYKDIEIEVTGDKNDDEAVSGIISKVKVIYNMYNVHLSFDLLNDKATVDFLPKTKNEISTEGYPKKIQKGIEEYFDSFTKPVSICTRISNNLRIYLPELISLLVDSVATAINATLNPEKMAKEVDSEIMDAPTPIENLSSDDIAFLQTYTKCISAPTAYSRTEKQYFRFPDSNFYMRSLDIEYLYAHAVTQTVIYSAKDTNDYLSRTIHEYASMSYKTYKHEFITKWMKAFGIGVDFNIRSVGGEAHIVHIINSDGEEVNLADKGMGSIQLMVLLFRLAITLPSKELTKERRIIDYRVPRINKVIIIEEPEQNLHPMLQSKLADLFYALNAEYGYRFIIETHSEYIIRKTQVIVKENFNDKKRPLKENPFKVFYFNSSDSEKPYYEIIYQKDGSFSNDFGKGFFDEASNLAFEIL